MEWNHAQRSLLLFTKRVARTSPLLEFAPHPNNEDHVYIVGGTTRVLDPKIGSTKEAGIMDPCIRKYSVSMMSQLWIAQLQVSGNFSETNKSSRIALGCDVVINDSLLYIAGDARNGGSIDAGKISTGGDDVFVVQLETNSGQWYWVQQVGAEGGWGNSSSPRWQCCDFW